METTKDRNILIAVDESENSKRALLYVADFLGGFPGFKAIILSVIPVPDEGFLNPPRQGMAGLNQKKERYLIFSKDTGRYSFSQVFLKKR